MRARGKKLGLGGMLLAGAMSLIGCGSAATTQSVDEIEALRSARRARTTESISDFRDGIQKISQGAVRDYATTAAASEVKDMKVLDDAKAERDRAIKLGEDLYAHMQGTLGTKAPKHTKKNPTKDKPSLEVSATATQRLDGESKPLIGGELEYKTGNGTYVTIGGAPQESVTETATDGSYNLTSRWNSMDFSVGKYKNFGKLTTKAGIGVNHETISTEGTVGITYIDDEDSKTTPYVEAGLEYTVGTSLKVGLDVQQTVLKDDSDKYTTTGTVSVGFSF